MLEIKSIQLHQLDMLKKLACFLEQENIRFFAIGGTALGAIRHQGFIPWDDDIDLALLRPDYEKLLSIQSKLPEEFFILNPRNNQNYPLLFSKLMNKKIPFVDHTLKRFALPNYIFIDLFPWDNIDNLQPYKSLRHKFRRSVYKTHGSLIDKIKYCFYRIAYGFKSPRFFYDQLQTNLTRKGNKGSVWSSATVEKDSLEYDDIFPLRSVPFEDTYIFIPNNCEKYLANKYGDFMTLPPEKDRVNHSTLAQNR